MTRLELKEITIAGLMIATMAVGITGFIGTGLDIYNVEDNVDQGELDRLKQIQESSSLASNASTNAQNVQAQADFFTTPNIIEVGKTVFSSIGVWQVFINVFVDATGINMAGNWFKILAIGALTISATFIFARRFL